MHLNKKKFMEFEKAGLNKFKKNLFSIHNGIHIKLLNMYFCINITGVTLKYKKASNSDSVSHSEGKKIYIYKSFSQSIY